MTRATSAVGWVDDLLEHARTSGVPVDFVFVIDQTGSMGDKIEAKRTARRRR